MEMAVCDAKASLEKKRKKRHTTRGNTNDGDCGPTEDNASTDSNVSQESLNKICLNMEPGMVQSHLEVNLSEEKNEKKRVALQCGEASGISVSTILNVEVLKAENEMSTSLNEDFCSADGKENSLVPEDPDVIGTNMVKRDDENTETIDHSTPSSHVETQGIIKIKCHSEKERSLESPKKSLESSAEGKMKVSLLTHPHEAETTGHLKNFAKEENGMLLEESIDCSISEETELSSNTKESSMVIADAHRFKDFENTSMTRKDDDCLDTKDRLAQSNSDDIHGQTKREREKSRRRRKFADTLEGSLNSDAEDNKKNATYSCLNEVGATSLHEYSSTTELVTNALVEEVSFNSSLGVLTSDVKERGETINQKVPRSLACDATSDIIGAVQEKNSLSRISNSSNERDATGFPKKKLLILDVNGLLVDFVPYFPDGYTPDIVISSKAVFKRPFCDDFLQFCFERFEVGIWSSRTWKNLNTLVKFIMRDSRHKLLFCWDQSHCTTTRFTTIENDRKPLVLKELKKIWESLEPNLPWKKGEYNASNTLLLDDTPYKALRNPANTAVFPPTYRYKDSDDTSLGPGGDLRTYLEGVSTAEDVQKYVELNPFGQKPISESSPFWNFYRTVINSERETWCR
ncbi:uncharacterized protein LOC111495745 isoform X1 [Cucurbita maxima]|uniref:Uncharacterized protein LOC111495745 isoform X1 n=2 Tax=Cucurbita maxima TaxID=3661 RepID=A0A6J1KLW3_CUCMA|nr:uncharacterized protein LOC111495745 isoform X1 [Cucurbita maxima]XP_023001690.1 uncharacterized protein LOC111495745 isoform X1 [Cucurbita maxima]